MKLKNAVLATVLGVGVLGGSLYASSASASSIETQTVKVSEQSVQNGGATTQGWASALTKAYVYGKEAAKHYAGKAADMFFNNGGGMSVSEKQKNADTVFDK